MTDQSIGARIAKYREAKGLSQSELARELGVTPQSVQKWESGGAPRTKRLEEIAAILGVPVARLVGGEQSAAVSGAGDWPFDRITQQEWMALPEKDKGAVEGYIERLLAERKRSSPKNNVA